METFNTWNFKHWSLIEKAAISQQTPITRHVLWINYPRRRFQSFSRYRFVIIEEPPCERRAKSFYLIKRPSAAHLNRTIGAMMNTFQYPDRRFIHLHHKSTHNHPSNRHRLQSATPSFNRTRRRWVRHRSTNMATRQQSSPHIKMCWATTSSGIAEAA